MCSYRTKLQLDNALDHRGIGTVGVTLEGIRNLFQDAIASAGGVVRTNDARDESHHAVVDTHSHHIN